MTDELKITGDELAEMAEQAEAIEVETEYPVSAAEKIMLTLKQISNPSPEAAELELTLSTVAMGLERVILPELERSQGSGELDEFILGLTRWIALHRSNSAKRLVVVELPRRDLPTATRLHLLSEASKVADAASSPFS
jgi:hypothetical protein